MEIESAKQPYEENTEDIPQNALEDKYRADEEWEREVSAKLSPICLEIKEIMNIIDNSQHKKLLSSQLYWKLSLILELLCMAPIVDKTKQKDHQESFVNLDISLVMIKEFRSCIDQLIELKYFQSFGKNNLFFTEIHQKYEDLIQKGIMKQLIKYSINIGTIGLAFRENIMLSEKLVKFELSQMQVSRYEDQVQECLEKMKKIRCAAGLSDEIKSELSLLLFYSGDGGLALLKTIDFEDFYLFFKEFIRNNEGHHLKEAIHKNKIKFYLDQQDLNQITPTMIDDFFNYCWCNPRDYQLMISEKVFEWDDIGNAQKMLKMEVLHTSEKCNIGDNAPYLKKGDTYLIDHKGYPQGSNYGNGIVRLGRKALTQPIQNDIFTHPKENSVSRRQLMITYKKMYNFRICCTSTTNSSEFVLEKNVGQKLFKDKTLRMGDKGFTMIVFSSNMINDFDDDEEEENKNPGMTTVLTRKFTSQAMKQMPNNFVDMTQQVTKNMQQAQQTEKILDKGMEALRNNDQNTQKMQQEEEKEQEGTCKISEFQEQNNTEGLTQTQQSVQEPEEDEEAATVNFKDEVKKEQLYNKLDLKMEYGNYLNAWIQVVVRWYTMGHNGVKQWNEKNLNIKAYDRKQIYSLGRSEKCDFAFPGASLCDIQCYIYYKDKQWFVKNANNLDFNDQKTLVCMQMKKVKQQLEHLPSSHYKVKNDMILGIMGKTYVRLTLDNEEQQINQLNQQMANQQIQSDEQVQEYMSKLQSQKTMQNFY